MLSFVAHTFVKDIMKKNVISIDSSMTVKDAATMMYDSDVGCLVVTKDKTAVGIVTERDIARRIVSKGKTSSTSISDIISSPLFVIGPEDTVWQACELMKNKGVHRVPVQKDNKLVGIVAASDIVKICSLGSESGMRKVCDEILLRLKDSDYSD